MGLVEKLNKQAKDAASACERARRAAASGGSRDVAALRAGGPVAGAASRL